MTAALPVMPVRLGPPGVVAVSVQSVGSAVPLLSFVTVLTSVRWGATSSLTNRYTGASRPATVICQFPAPSFCG